LDKEKHEKLLEGISHIVRLEENDEISSNEKSEAIAYLFVRTPPKILMELVKDEFSAWHPFNNIFNNNPQDIRRLIFEKFEAKFGIDKRLLFASEVDFYLEHNHSFLSELYKSYQSYLLQYTNGNNKKTKTLTANSEITRATIYKEIKTGKFNIMLKFWKVPISQIQDINVFTE